MRDKINSKSWMIVLLVMLLFVNTISTVGATQTSKSALTLTETNESFEPFVKTTAVKIPQTKSLLKKNDSLPETIQNLLEEE